MIRCGWCGAPTPEGACTSCGRDAALPYLQRGTEPALVDPLDTIRHRLAKATAELGGNPTIEQLADQLDCSPRTVRRWRKATA